MVKRQTVWLSTMMVLSLMLIGYYTMNNGVSTTTSNTSGGPSVTTSAGNPPTTTTTGGATATSGASSSNTTSAPSGSSSANTTGTSSTGGTTLSASDWFVKMETQVNQDLSRQEDVYSQIISSNNATASQMTQAEDQLKQLETLIGEIGNARDAVMGEGYSACVIVPDLKTNAATVYVQTTNLTASNAVKIMNIVSQNLNIPISNVVVNAHS